MPQHHVIQVGQRYEVSSDTIPSLQMTYQSRRIRAEILKGGHTSAAAASAAASGKMFKGTSRLICQNLWAGPAVWLLTTPPCDSEGVNAWDPQNLHGL